MPALNTFPNNYSHDVLGGPDSHGPVRRTGEEFLVHGSQAVD